MIAIRPYTLGDAEALWGAALESVETVGPWLPWCRAEMNLDEVREWIGEQIAHREAGTGYQFVIHGDDSGADEDFLGSCGLSRIDKEHRLANLGYWIRASRAGRGVVPAACRLAVEWAFEATNLERIEIICDVENRPSQRVAEKLGARREGLLRRRLHVHGRPRDAYVYSLIRPDAT